MRVLIHNQKGGVGKTTTAINLAAALCRQSDCERVLLADLDPQQHLTAMVVTLPTDPENPAPCGGGIGALAVKGEPGLFLARGDTLINSGLFGMPQGIDANWTILDTPPIWSPRMAEASLWADLILCPLEPDFLGLSGVGRLLEHIEAQAADRNKLRFLLTRFNGRLALHREVRERLFSQFGDLLLPVEIRSSIKLAEAPGMGRTIFAHGPRSSGSIDYRALAVALQETKQPAGKIAA